MTSPSTPRGTAPASQPSPAFCAACGSALSAGARFCHRCGTPVGQGVPVMRTTPPASAASILPWGVAFVALLALVAVFAGQNFGKPRGSGVDGSANSLPTSAIDGAAGGTGGGPAPNIANLSPSERASRLYIRIMTYAEQGQVDSVSFFAPMALGSHEMLTAPTTDERYHFGRIAEVVGNADIARAQADTILAQQPRNLLGLLLAGRAARMRNDSAAARAFDRRLLDALPTELAGPDEDYRLHRAEIDRAAADARGAN